MGCAQSVGQCLVPTCIRQGQIEEAFDHAKPIDPVASLLEGLAQLFGGHMGRSAGHPGQREHHKGPVAFELCPRGLNLDLLVLGTLAEGGFESIQHGMMQAGIDEVDHASCEMGVGDLGR